MASTQEENTVPETKVLAVASHVCLSSSLDIPMILHDPKYKSTNLRKQVSYGSVLLYLNDFGS